MTEQVARLGLVPAVTAAQMREVDRIMVEDIGISLLQMMENAGRAFAELTRIQLSGSSNGRVVVLAGRGGNGGVGWRPRDGWPSGGPRCALCSPIKTPLLQRPRPIS